jgi:hypothetical protein
MRPEMNEIRRILPLAALAGVAALAARPAAACEPDAMDAHLTAVCDGALGYARAAVEAALPHATPEERLAMQRSLTLANGVCSTGDPIEGARVAAGLARMAGRIEGRAGGNPLDITLTG